MNMLKVIVMTLALSLSTSALATGGKQGPPAPKSTSVVTEKSYIDLVIEWISNQSVY